MREWICVWVVAVFISLGSYLPTGLISLDVCSVQMKMKRKKYKKIYWNKSLKRKRKTSTTAATTTTTTTTTTNNNNNNNNNTVTNTTNTSAADTTATTTTLIILRIDLF